MESVIKLNPYFSCITPTILKKKLTHIAITIGICLIIGFLSGFATETSANDWYPTLNKPNFSLPNWLFTPIWTVLYILMGIAAGIVWARGFYHLWVKTALYHFGFLVLYSSMWSMLFFGLRKPFWALVVAITLIILLLFTMRWSKVISRITIYLLVPHLLWISYLTFLSFKIWQLN